MPDNQPAIFPRCDPERQIVSKYEGTRVSRQELNAELLEDVRVALWTIDRIDAERRAQAPVDLVRVVAAVDPAVSKREAKPRDTLFGH
jgi:phage terminase large subunit-like protein